MPGVEAEAIRALGLVGEIVDDVDRGFEHEPARLAHEVLVPLVGKVEHDGAVLDVHVLDHTDRLEQA